MAGCFVKIGFQFGFSNDGFNLCLHLIYWIFCLSGDNWARTNLGCDLGSVRSFLFSKKWYFWLIEEASRCSGPKSARLALIYEKTSHSKF